MPYKDPAHRRIKNREASRQRRAQIRDERRLFVKKEARFSRWFDKTLRENVLRLPSGFANSSAARSPEAVLATSRGKAEDYESYLRRLRKGQVANPQATTVFEIGAALAECGVPVSGPIALFHARRFPELIRFLDALAAQKRTRASIGTGAYRAILLYRSLWSLEFDLSRAAAYADASVLEAINAVALAARHRLLLNNKEPGVLAMYESAWRACNSGKGHPRSVIAREAARVAEYLPTSSSSLLWRLLEPWAKSVDPKAFKDAQQDLAALYLYELAVNFPPMRFISPLQRQSIAHGENSL